MGPFHLPYGPMMRRWLDSLPQDKFWEVRRQRKEAGGNVEEQQRLALEDRRAFSRELVRDEGMLPAAGLLFQIPGEQVVKAFSPSGRSGFFDPLGNIKAGYTGVLQGLDDRGMFGGR